MPSIVINIPTKIIGNKKWIWKKLVDSAKYRNDTIYDNDRRDDFHIEPITYHCVKITIYLFYF